MASSPKAPTDEIHFRIALRSLKAASSDTEKFCALLIIAKFLKPNKLSDEETFLIFKEIGWKFLNRLLLTDASSGKIPEGCKATIFQSISVNILTCLFLSNLQLLDRSVCTKLFTSLNEILRSGKTEEDEAELRRDVLYCCNTFVESSYTDEEVILVSLHSNLIETISLSFLDDERLNGNFLQLAVKLASRSWPLYDLESYNAFLLKFAQKMRENSTLQKFEWCSKICSCLPKSETLNLDAAGVKDWVSILGCTIYDTLRSKVTDGIRNSNFQLSASLTESFGSLNWVLHVETLDDGNRKKLFLLLSKLVCIELSVQLGSKNANYSSLASCFLILENVIMSVVNDEERRGILKDVDGESIMCLINDIRGSMMSIIGYLQEMHLQWEEQSGDPDKLIAVLGCIRLLCCWVAEETDTLTKEIRDVLPFILQIVSTELNKGSGNLIPTDVIVTALHSLCINDPKAKDMVVQSNIINEIADNYPVEQLGDDIEHMCRCLQHLCK